MMMRTPRIRSTFIVVFALLMLVSGACSKDSHAVGTYVNDPEGTIVLSEGGKGTWTQSGDPFEFNWSQDGDTIEFDVGDGEPLKGVKLVDGNLVLPDGATSQDGETTFKRE